MNATRRLAKSSSVLKYSYNKGFSTNMNFVQGFFIILLIIYSAIIVKYVPINVLSFFDNIVTKIVVLIIIAFVGLYSPAVALFIAIALISTLQAGQKKKITTDIRNMAPLPDIKKQEVDNKLNELRQKMMRDSSPPPKKMMESIDGSAGYLDPAFMGGSERAEYEQDMQMDFKPLQAPPAVPQQAPSSDYLPMKQEDQDMEDFDYKFVDPSKPSPPPVGYNNDAPCLSCGDGGTGTANDSQCGYVKTWNNQFSAQGLGMDITGFQESNGYPFLQ